MHEKFPHYITPASTITKAFNMFLEDDSLSGKVAECVIDKIYLRDQHPVCPCIDTADSCLACRQEPRRVYE